MVKIEHFAGFGEVAKAAERLCKHAEAKKPGRSWFLDVKLWQDKDYLLVLTSTWGRQKTEVRYRKSEGKTTFHTILEEDKTDCVERLPQSK